MKFVRCSIEGCDIIIGNGTHGAKKPRPCSRCAFKSKQASVRYYCRLRYKARKAAAA